MARRKQKRFESTFLVLLAGAVVVWVISKVLQQVSPGLLLVVIAAVLVLVIRKLLRPAQLRKSSLAKVNGAIQRHIEQLVRQKARLVRSDPYGKVQLDKWTNEIEYFVDEHLSPLLTKDEISALPGGRVKLSRMVRDSVDLASKDRPVFESFSSNLTPMDFEIFCAEQLRSSGWDARVTRQSRDQGVDVVAEKAGIRVVLQCKLYSNPVGNKAVQEIVAGRTHEQAHYGAVVTNNRYTSAAEELASTNGVFLLHYNDLAQLDKIVGDRSSSLL
jgi:restriction system protein